MAIDKQQFKRYFDDRTSDDFNRIECIRDRMIRSARNKKICSIPFVVLAGLFGFICIEGEAESLEEYYIGATVLTGMMIAGIVYMKPKSLCPQQRIRYIKNECKKSVFNLIFYLLNIRDLKYTPVIKTHLQQFKKTTLFGDITEINEDDGIIGAIHGFNIKISEVHARSGLKKIFGGLFVTMDIPIKCKVDRLLLSKNAQQTKHSPKRIFGDAHTPDHPEEHNRGNPQEDSLIAGLVDLIENIASFNNSCVKGKIIKNRFFMIVEANNHMFEINVDKCLQPQKEQLLEESYLLYCLISEIEQFYKTLAK